jgi:hypothetical protein
VILLPLLLRSKPKMFARVPTTVPLSPQSFSLMKNFSAYYNFRFLGNALAALFLSYL